MRCPRVLRAGVRKFQCGPNRRCVTLSYAIDVLYNVSGVLKPKKIDTSSGCVCASPQLVSSDNATVAGRARRVDNPGYYLRAVTGLAHNKILSSASLACNAVLVAVI
ncbi:hypothetical protein MRX96_025967 [Rhipicephalus microplus]